MDGQQDRGEEGEPPPPPRRETGTGQVWAVLRSGLTVTEMVAQARQHEALAWTARALAVLGDIAVMVWEGRRR